MTAKYIDSTDTFRLSLMGYCGMRIPIVDEGTMEECRLAAARRLFRLRADGFPISIQEKGKEWEVCEPDDCAMVPDDCGLLLLRPVRVKVFECFECGCDVPEGEACSCSNCAFCDSPDCGGGCQQEEQE